MPETMSISDDRGTSIQTLYIPFRYTQLPDAFFVTCGALKRSRSSRRQPVMISQQCSKHYYAWDEVAEQRPQRSSDPRISEETEFATISSRNHPYYIDCPAITLYQMAKGLRASSKKANRSIIRSRIFGPAEEQRTQRLSARLVELASQSNAGASTDGDLANKDIGPSRTTCHFHV